MRSERGAWSVGPIAGIVIAVLAVIGLLAVCSEGDGDVETLRFPVTLVAVESPSAQAGPVGDGGASPRDHDGCWDGGCSDDWRGGGYREHNGGGSGDGRGGDGRFGGGRSGDYDGGPGDDCRNACGNTIIVPSPGGGEGEGRD